LSFYSASSPNTLKGKIMNYLERTNVLASQTLPQRERGGPLGQSPGREIPALMARLEEQLNAVNARISQLQERLAPVLIYEEPSLKDSATAALGSPSSTPLSSRFNDYLRQASGATFALESILSRLEL
jgi:hypothetical protein